MIELQELEKLQGKSAEEAAAVTNISIERYKALRNGDDLPTEEESKLLSAFYKVPKSFFAKAPQFVHHGSANSFGPIYKNTNFFFTTPESEEMIKKLLSDIN